MKKALFFLVFSFLASAIFAQNDTLKNNETVKTGFSLGGVPVVAYNTDTGFKYGGLVNFYWYGDGTNYPNYDHSLYMEWSRTTKGSGINQITYDTRTLIPNMRMQLDARYLTEQALDFYGFNGYNAYYNGSFSNDTDTAYISRMFYRHERKMVRLKADFEGNTGIENLRWLAGFAHHGVDISSVDLETLNEGQSEEDMLPDTATLYDRYVEWGVIKADQAEGGKVNSFKLGMVYDSRDNEANPNHGMWSEMMAINAPGFLGNDYAYTKLMLTHRQYFTVVPSRLTFAYRLSWQTKIAGEIPFYMLPFIFESKDTNDGLGGSKNLRGVYRNRLQGDGVAYGNMEFRWKFFKTVFLNQNIYLGLNTFLDAGIVTGKYQTDLSGVTGGYGNSLQENLNMIEYEDESLHPSYGAGFRIVLNNNFILAFEYGRAFNIEKDGSGFYIGLNYAF